jgi:hypothetical protein
VPIKDWFNLAMVTLQVHAGACTRFGEPLESAQHLTPASRALSSVHLCTP